DVFGVELLIAYLILINFVFGDLKEKTGRQIDYGFIASFLYIYRNTRVQGLLNEEVEEDDDDEEEDNNSDCDIMTETEREDHEEFRDPRKSSQEILNYRTENGTICREFPVKETHKVIRSEDEDGNKMVNEYVRECKIGAGSYGKVVLYRSLVDGKHYAIK
nr:serine/threonine-protein kinase GRIK2-like isoform X1 [Tanacetum cinerariifolium]